MVRPVRRNWTPVLGSASIAASTFAAAGFRKCFAMCVQTVWRRLITSTYPRHHRKSSLQARWQNCVTRYLREVAHPLDALVDAVDEQIHVWKASIHPNQLSLTQNLEALGEHVKIRDFGSKSPRLFMV